MYVIKHSETFQCTHVNSCHPAGVKKGFVIGEALRLLRTNTPKEVKNERKEALQQKLRSWKKFPPFVTQFQPSFRNVRNILMDKWHVMQNQP